VASGGIATGAGAAAGYAPKAGAATADSAGLLLEPLKSSKPRTAPAPAAVNATAASVRLLKETDCGVAVFD
jgi:hypothetical protein